MEPVILEACDTGLCSIKPSKRLFKAKEYDSL